MEIRQSENEDQVSNASEALQAKFGLSGDSQSSKISEVIKLGSLENASMHSLFNVVGRILYESIEEKNENIPQRIASVLNLLVQEIKHRVLKQADNLRKQSNLYESHEDRYRSKIKALETLATGTIEENEVLINKLQQLKIERAAMEEKKKLQEQDLIELRKEKNGFECQILSLNEQLAVAQKSYERKLSENEAKAQETKDKLKEKIVELETHLIDSRKKVKQLEDFTESKFTRWKIREHGYRSFMDSQSSSLKDLRMASESIKQEVSKIRNTYAEEFYHFGINLKGVIDAAQNYHTVLEENRKLYNEVQDLKGKDSHRLFKFNKVFGAATTQEEVFRDTQLLIRSVLDGYNVCIFAYGQTGSRKTYTMMGTNVTSVINWGVNYRALNDLFTISKNRHRSISYEICVQMVEIYNEQVRDLLRNKGIQKIVPDASLHPVKSMVDVLELMNIGLMNRAVGATALNERSSRSHSILTVHVRGMDLETNAILRGCLHLVDLAGSERVDRSEATGERLREAHHINKSLSSLGDVIFALAQKTNLVPYRNSKLTQVLQSSLGGQAKTLMFVQLNPDVQSYSETISTLKFAERVSGVELGAAQSNKEGRGVRELMEQVASLKDAIAQKDDEIQRLRSANTNGNSVESRGRFAGAKLFSEKAAAYDMDHSSESSYKQSEAGSHSSPDDVKHHEEFRQSNVDVIVGGGNSFPEDTGLKLDFSGSGTEDDNSEERLSDISDGVSMGTETDGSINRIVDLKLFPKNGKSSSSEGSEKSNGPAKLPRPAAKHIQAKPSRSSLSESSSKIPSAKRAAPSSTSSAAKPPRKWP